MSFALDTNILVYASDSTSPFHARASELLASCASGREIFYLTWGTLMSYLRLATHPAVSRRPMTPEEAMRNVEALAALPHVRILTEQDGFWEVYRKIAGEIPVRGNLVPDAHLAAILRQHGVKTIYTNDADFLKFGFLDVRNPFKPSSRTRA